MQKRSASGSALHRIAMMLYLPGNPSITRITGKTCQKIAMDGATRAESNYDVEELGLERNGTTCRVVTGLALFTASLTNLASGTYTELGAS